jgi:hypothetical protein
MEGRYMTILSSIYSTSTINSHTDLCNAIANWLARDGDANITYRVPDFIVMAEARVNYGASGNMPSDPLRIRPMETLTTLAVTGGVNTVALPSGYLGMRRLQIANSPNVKLEFLSPAQFDREYPDDTSTGVPKKFTIEGENIRLGPMPDKDYTLNCLYYKKFDQLQTAGSNWLLQNHPGIYLYGALIEAAPYVGDDGRLNTWYQAFSGSINGLQSQDALDRHGGNPLVASSDARRF